MLKGLPVIKDYKMSEETNRKCVVSGEIKSKEQLLRFTVLSDGRVVPDFRKKLPGKGVYVTVAKSALEKAVAANLFAKALKIKTKVNEELVEQTESLLRKQALDAVSLARKAGVLVCGMDKVVDALKRGKAAFLIEAKNAGDDGHQKILALAKELEVFSLFETEELDKELARDNTVHLALLKSRMANAVRETIVRLTSFLNS